MFQASKTEILINHNAAMEGLCPHGQEACVENYFPIFLFYLTF